MELPVIMQMFIQVLSLLVLGFGIYYFLIIICALAFVIAGFTCQEQGDKNVSVGLELSW